jgi:ribonuclease HI
MLKRVQIHTDGACRGNPGPGGYGAVLICGKHRLEIAQGYAHTTNNRMELLAAIAALEVLKQPCEIELISDSRYLVDAMNKRWLRSWESKGWRTAANEPVKNQDLWQRLSKAAAPHKILWTWIKGHAGHRENERCDVLAVAASQKNPLFEDQGFKP